MILIILLIVIAIVSGFIASKVDDFNLVLWLVSVMVCVILAVLAVVLTCVLINKSVTEASELAAYQVRYESIIRQIDMYDDKDYSKRDLYTDIERWNYDLTKSKKLRENVFIRDFCYDIDDFQLIEFPDS